MPQYDFKCLKCQSKFEALVSPQKKTAVKCLQCGSTETEKLLSAPAIILKGKGFYKTDNQHKHSHKPEQKAQKSSGCDGGSCGGCSGCG